MESLYHFLDGVFRTRQRGVNKLIPSVCTLQVNHQVNAVLLVARPVYPFARSMFRAFFQPHAHVKMSALQSRQPTADSVTLDCYDSKFANTVDGCQILKLYGRRSVLLILPQDTISTQQNHTSTDRELLLLLLYPSPNGTAGKTSASRNTKAVWCP